MVRFRALYLWCCGGRHDSDDLGNPELSFPVDNPGSTPQDQGISGVQMSRSIDDTSLSAVILQDKDLDAAPRLNLIPIESPALQQKEVLRINAYGLEGSLRGKRDGVTYIGSDPSEGNDFAIPKDISLGRKHLMIRFNASTSKYYLKDLGEGTGTFVRIDVPVLLRHGFIISFGESHLVVHLTGSAAQ